MSTVSGIGSTSSDIRGDYLQLLIAQLQNQDPLEPASNNEMVAQLAQLSQLEQLENISGTFSDVLAGVQLAQARDLIGKIVSFVPEGTDTEYWGKVDGVDIVSGEVRLRLGTYSLDLSEVRSIRDAATGQDDLTDRLLRATALVGKQVAFEITNVMGQSTQLTGLVDAVTVSDGTVVLSIGDRIVPLEDIQAVRN